VNIQIIRQSTQADALMEVGPVPVPLSQPPCVISEQEVKIPGKPDCSTGLWECSPGKFERQIKEAEVMHILAGVCTFTPRGSSEALLIKAGDTVFFPENTFGSWDIQETVRKVYVLV